MINTLFNLQMHQADLSKIRRPAISIKQYFSMIFHDFLLNLLRPYASLWQLQPLGAMAGESGE
ncbi:hypothetical protein [Methylobacter sp.]|uniref:hypothetical protein n=1 Tax=Methylobacter sp. TaxID=2051955 RepID=UPI003DA22BD2